MIETQIDGFSESERRTFAIGQNLTTEKSNAVIDLTKTVFLKVVHITP